ncbi:DUF423 domain-containing protein [Xanthomarina spongicola]|jgi:uncharacterized membrane protein YgdD (TMEM256/DUF423 family)|uniref:Uncharacterized membrane protein YgdD (TMEM256/DUF423 family) n=1 Tax=Xanthomarina spongicola TaxID=570520 RepID=A0A316DM35_9FLAO|nr:DUF423 domain-containing protein [Xanthomarina spongicola]PWK18965.1 uncharacterized membrane protein YgdD (TMEM256/DUF423 family) [Xanthomarina spongicola]
MNKKILITASILGVLSIVLGAFASHGLKELISEEAIRTFETGVKYQMYHAILLLFVGNSLLVSVKSKKAIFFLVITGLLFFSGSIYGLATNSITTFDFKNIGFITPIGGLLLIMSWIILLINFLKMKTDNS